MSGEPRATDEDRRILEWVAEHDPNLTFKWVGEPPPELNVQFQKERVMVALARVTLDNADALS